MRHSLRIGSQTDKQPVANFIIIWGGGGGVELVFLQKAVREVEYLYPSVHGDTLLPN